MFVLLRRPDLGDNNGRTVSGRLRASGAGLTRRRAASAFAVLRLMTSSNLFACSTGISAGFAPRRILVDQFSGAPITFGAATEVVPKFISPADPAARWTGAHGGQAFYAYSTNYLIDV